MKTRSMVEAYVDLVREVEPRRIVEIGIRKGGSTALLHAMAEPDRLVALELASGGAWALDRYLDDHGQGVSIRPYFGVDQGDSATVASICDDEFGDAPLDLVVDDASHLYEPSVASFEVLFPRLRPGGRYIIEDWTSYYLRMSRAAAAYEDALATASPEVRAAWLAGLKESSEEPIEPLISLLTVELVLARASESDLIRDITVTRHWTVVTRGAEPIVPDGFRLRDHYRDHMALLHRVSPPSLVDPLIASGRGT